MTHFLHGLYWGLGFMTAAISITPIYYLVNRIILKKFGLLQANFQEKKFRKASEVKVTLHRYYQIEDELKVLGELANHGQDTWDDIRINVDMYDANSNFLDQDYGNFPGVIEPGDKKHFAFEVEYETLPSDIKVNIASADYVHPKEGD